MTNADNERHSILIDGTDPDFHGLDIRKIMDRFSGKRVVERFYMMTANAAAARARAVKEILEARGFSVMLCGQYAISDIVIGMLDATEECDRLALFSGRPALAPIVQYLRDVEVEVDVYGFEGRVHKDLIEAAETFNRLSENDRYRASGSDTRSIPLTPDGSKNWSQRAGRDCAPTQYQGAS